MSSFRFIASLCIFAIVSSVLITSSSADFLDADSGNKAPGKLILEQLEAAIKDHLLEFKGKLSAKNPQLVKDRVVDVARELAKPFLIDERRLTCTLKIPKILFRFKGFEEIVSSPEFKQCVKKFAVATIKNGLHKLETCDPNKIKRAVQVALDVGMNVYHKVKGYGKSRSAFNFMDNDMDYDSDSDSDLDSNSDLDFGSDYDSDSEGPQLLIQDFLRNYG